MDFQGIAAIVFVLLLTAFLAVRRKQLHFEKILFPLLYFCMYRTGLGLGFMESAARRFRRILLYLSCFAVFVGFAGMLLIAYELSANWLRLLFAPKAASAVSLVLPFRVKGAFFVPFFYWIVSIFIIAVVHEFSHGVVARLHGVRIKSSGFAFLGILLPVLPAAFVEPDEAQLKRLGWCRQLGIFAAGPFSNILLGLACLGILFLVLPAVSKGIFDYDGVLVTGIANGSPASLAGMHSGELIRQVNGADVLRVDNFTAFLGAPGSAAYLVTNVSSYNLTLAAHPDNASAGYLGVFVQQSTRLKDSFVAAYGSFAADSIVWLVGLVFWLYLLNIGIGLFNLVPLGPIDGGRMLKTALLRFLPETRAVRIWAFVSGLFLFLIAANILFSFFR